MEPIQIYFENSSILICEKPAGISSEDGGLPDILCKQIGINKLYTPPLEGFRTEKGEVIDAPLIQATRKAGGSYGK